MYTANAKILRLVPNATYIPLTGIGGFALGDTKDLGHQTQKIPTCWYPQRQVFCVAVEYRL